MRHSDNCHCTREIDIISTQLEGNTTTLVAYMDDGRRITEFPGYEVDDGLPAKRIQFCVPCQEHAGNLSTYLGSNGPGYVGDCLECQRLSTGNHRSNQLLPSKSLKTSRTE